MIAASRSSIGGAVNNAISLILNSIGPAQVARVKASYVAISAGMGSLVLWIWWLTMNTHTEIAANEYSWKLVDSHFDAAKSFFGEGKWPDQAIIANVINGGFKKYLDPRKRLGILRSEVKVFFAEASKNSRLAATIDRAYTGISHRIILRMFCIGEKPLDVPTSGGFAMSSI